jgi:FtsP/CotA-like multicopper oxidase with cupredoxin domain
MSSRTNDLGGRDNLQHRISSRTRAAVGRRDFLRLATGAGVALGMAGFGVGGRDWNLITPRHAAAAQPLVEPEIRASRDGLLDTTLEASVMAVDVAGKTAIMSVYEGSVPGPTLRVRPGDTLRINLVNNLDDLPDGIAPDSPFQIEPEAEPGHKVPHGNSGDTNLHVHGFHVTPVEPSDNVFVRVQPGESYQYEIQIPPDHPAGTYIYHPHFHGNTHVQVFGGMGGALIVEGEFDRLPGIDGLIEHVLVLQATQFNDDGSGVIAQEDARQSKYLRLVNGQINPTLTTRPGETRRWRIVNITASTTFRLHLDGHQLHQIGKDGNPLNATWTRDDIVLAPGERADVLVQGGEAGTYALRTLPIATGFTTQQEAVLATLVSAGEAMTAEPLPPELLPLEDLSGAEIDGRRQITFQVAPPTDPRGAAFMISGKEFDIERDDQVVQLDTTEEWVIRNASSVWHPFHIHINPYQVVAYNGQPVQVRSFEDTTAVPPFGEITIRTRFLDYPGRWVYHCHILLHEDRGMMGTVRALA